jgi:transposase
LTPARLVRKVAQPIFHATVFELERLGCALCGALFDALTKEQKLADLDRLAFHQAHSQPVLDDLQKWRQEQIEQKKVEPNSGLGEAIQCMLKRWQTLTQFLSVPGAPLDNLVENDVRPSVVGRKRWLFIGHPDAGWRSAVISTIIQSCRRRGINPQEYVTDVLGRLPWMKNHEVKDVLPSRWKLSPARPA